jgi:hypothetical protein
MLVKESWLRDVSKREVGYGLQPALADDDLSRGVYYHAARGLKYLSERGWST